MFCSLCVIFSVKYYWCPLQPFHHWGLLSEQGSLWSLDSATLSHLEKIHYALFSEICKSNRKQDEKYLPSKKIWFIESSIAAVILIILILSSYLQHYWSFCPIEYIQQTFVGLEDVLKTSWRHISKTSSTSLKLGRIQLFKEVSQNFSKVGDPKLAATNVSDHEKSMWIKYLR